MSRYVVGGGGGMIGSALTGRLLADGHDVLSVDVKPLGEWWQRHDCESLVRDLEYETECVEVMKRADVFVDLCERMGGIGFIHKHQLDCSISASRLRGNLLQAAIRSDVERYCFASSACSYRVDLQDDPDNKGLREEDAWPANPEPGYGLLKVVGEEMCRYARADYGLRTTIPRFHNIGGPPSTWHGGKEKAPAAICRKVAEAKLIDSRAIEIWGDGTATRSYCFLDDCVEGVVRLIESDYPQPINLGSSEMVSVDDLVTLVEECAFGESGVLDRTYDLDAPTGVAGRNSNNERIRQVLGWEPSTKLAEWMPILYNWVESQVAATLA